MAEVYRGVWVIGYRELLRFVQDRSRLFSSFGMPLLFLLIFGAGFNRTIGSLTPGVDYITFMYPGIIAMTVLTSSLFAGLSVVWDREFGFLKEVLVAPVSRTGIVLGKAGGGAVIAVVQGIVMLLLAPVLGVSLSVPLVVKLVPLLILLACAVSGLGVFIAARVHSQQGFQVLMQLVVMPLMFTAGVFFPVQNVPVWLQVIVKLNPATYGVDAIRQLFLGGKVAALPAAVPGAVAAGGGSPLGVSLFGHTMGIAEDALAVAAVAVVLLTAAAWAFNRET